jgi:hypothetical protein
MGDAEIAVILRRLDDQDRTLGRIEGKVDKTNGRVTKLETDRAVGQELAKVHARSLDVRKAWMIGIASAIVTGAAGSLIIILLGGHT